MIRELEILAPGIFTTVQDLGRPGSRNVGVAACGAVDPVSMRIANFLVGNDDNAACLECALVGPTIRFRRDCRVALCGANSAGIPNARALRIRARQVVSIGALAGSAYAYLAIAGGIDVPTVLGSRSTDTRVGIGGHEGRLLQRGDVLRIGNSNENAEINAAEVSQRALLDSSTPIRIVRAAPDGRTNPLWIGGTFRVSPRSDRMGLRLVGEWIAGDRPAKDESSVVLPGTIQLPPNGEPIVLMADAQTLGGYPQIGHVIEADLPRLAQRRPGSIVRFELCSIAEAHRLLHSQERKLALLRYAIGLKVKR